LSTLLCVAVKPRTTGLRNLVGRNGRVEQLSLLESPRPNSNAAVWETLDDQRKSQIVMILARLIIQLATGARAELEHKHE
jgi:hypothetical protein